MSLSHVPAALRRLVRERANERCEYCLMPEALAFALHTIDHIVAEKHGGQTEAGNLALACTLCNQHKGSDLSSIDLETGVLTPLFHPRMHGWAEHFCMAAGRIEGLTPIGVVTARLLKFNETDRVRERVALLAAGSLWIDR